MRKDKNKNQAISHVVNNFKKQKKIQNSKPNKNENTTLSAQILNQFLKFVN